MTENINKELETGRSMVEMLGVLAVVGVLSVGSIAGYRYAMDNYYTNEILAGASQRAVLVAAQITAGQTPSLAEFRKMNDTAGGEFATDAVTDIDDAVGIKVTGVKDSVCENLVKLENDRVYMAKDDASLTALTEADCTGDNATFLIVFEGMGGGSGEGNGGGSISCPTCDATTEEECDALDGVWKCGEEDLDQEHCACGKTEEDIVCGEWGYACISCPEGQEGKCASDGDNENACLCADSLDDITCGYFECITCPSGLIAKCSDMGNCVCAETLDDVVCGEEICIVKPEGKECKCSKINCECSDALDDIFCSDMNCIICPEGDVECAWISGECVCVPDGNSAKCNDENCVSCPSGQTPTCDGGYGECECV